MNMDNGGGGVDEMGFNEAELLYMAAPKQMIVGGACAIYSQILFVYRKLQAAFSCASA